jgi:hypothetical protein
MTMSKCVLAVLCAAAGVLVSAGDEKKPVPLYTNEDLRRIAPLRGETGVDSRPAAAPAAAAPAREGEARGEEYWRREADRLRERLRPLRERAAELRLKIEDRRRQPRVPVYGDPQVTTMQRRLRAVEEQIREAESRFEDRARRERAMPGWIR